MKMSRRVSSVYESYPKRIKDQLMIIRQLIFDVAKKHSEVGKVTETLKWNEPSYLTLESKTGSTIRLAWKRLDPKYFGIFFNCKSSMIPKIKEKYGSLFKYEKNRALIFHEDDSLPLREISECIYMALLYHSQQSR